jgi:dipeptidyl aminopeptidase/acylaminoacyl peptidase
MPRPLVGFSLALLSAAWLTPSAPAVAQATAPFTVNDLIAIDRLSEPAVSPDGARVVFTKSVLDAPANRRRTDLWIVNLDGSGLRQLTTDPASDTSAVWAPDGRAVYFLSSRSGSSQVWRVAPDSGEQAQVTRLPLDVGSFALSRDGQQLAVSLEVFVDCPTLECTVERVGAAAKRQASGMLFDRLFVRHWDSWADGRRSHIFVVPVAGGAPVNLMKEIDADSPSKPFGGAEEFTFTPDGTGVVATLKHAADDEAWSTDFDVTLFPLAAGEAPFVPLSSDNPGWDTGPVFSPDGRTLAFRSMEREGFEADRFTIQLWTWPGGPRRTIAADWDRSPQELVWSPDGATLYATADNLGQTSLFAIDVATGRVRTLIKDGHVASPAVAGDRIVVLLDHLRAPAEVHVVGADGQGLRQVTRINETRLAKVAFGEPEQMTFTGAKGDTVHAWTVKPVNFQTGRRYPVAFLIHGGPQGSFGNNFHYRWNPQIYAAAGYAVVMVDFHGSTGYGQAFSDAIRMDWGGAPLEDLQKGLEAAVAKYPWMDGGRACALGASYGGYMINWIAGNWPDGFRCLVNHAGNLDERFAYFSTEELWFPEWERNGPPWERPEEYQKHNPIEHVAKWKTPMLVTHGMKDYRVLYSEGLATFTALQRRGVPSRLLVFPDENHWVLKPANSVLWHETVLEWLARWTKE